MKYLCLAILCSVAISTLLRLSEKSVKHKMVLFTSNYMVDVLLSLFFLFLDNGSQLQFDDYDAGFGLVSGVMYLVSFVLLQYNIRKNGVVLSATFMKLGVLIPILVSIFIFHEIPGIYQKIGFGVALLAILLIYIEKSEQKTSAKVWLVILLLAGGLTDVWAKVYEEIGNQSHMNSYLLITFATAAILSLANVVVKRQQVTLKDVAWGIAVGVPNYLSSRFLLFALLEMDGIIVFPVFNVATIFLLGMIGAFFFKEKLSKQKWIGYAFVIVAILLLNI